VRVFKTKWFARFTRKEGITDARLVEAVRNAEKGQIDAVLGGGLIKQRIPRDGGGKSGGYRSIIAYKAGDKYFFLYCFAKRDKDNLEDDELEQYKRFAGQLMALGDADLKKALDAGTITEVKYDEKGKGI
jgi:hypothetical protein